LSNASLVKYFVNQYVHYQTKTNVVEVLHCSIVTSHIGVLIQVFQRRQDNTTDFIRNWKDYKEGFGKLTGNFWLGELPQFTLVADKVKV